MTLATGLNLLESRGLIQIAGLQPDLSYAFRHTLLQEAAYASLTKQDRRNLHQSVGIVLERLYPERREELAPILGRHFLEAGDRLRARKYYQVAADAAMRLYAVQEAVMHYSQSLIAAEGEPVERARLFRARGGAYEILGDFQRARSDLVNSRTTARAVQDRQLEWQALLDLGFLWASRNYSHSGDHYQRALKIAQETGDRRAIAYSLNRIGNWNLNLDQVQEAQQYHLEALAIFQELQDPPGMADTFDLLGLTSYLVGDLVQGTDYYRQAISLFRQLDDCKGLVSSLTLMAFRGANYRADHLVPAANSIAEAAREGRIALRLARRIHWRAGEAFALCTLGMFCLGSQGLYNQALDHLQRGQLIAQEIKHRQWITAANCYLGAVFLDLLSLPEALFSLSQALAIAHEIQSPYWVRMISALLVQVYIQQGDFTQADLLLKEILSPDPAAQTISKQLAWRARGELALAQGDPQAALEAADRLQAAARNPSGDRKTIRVSKLRGEALMTLSQLDQAEIELKVAGDIAQAQGAKPALWRIQALIAKLYRLQGNFNEAEGELAKARSLVQELSMNLPEGSLRENYLRRAMIRISLESSKTVAS